MKFRKRLGELGLTYSYYFLEIPIAIRYEMGEKQLKPFIETGISPSIYLFNQNDNDFNDSELIGLGNAPSSNFNIGHIVGQFSLGLNYEPSSKIAFFAQPIFRYHFTPLVDAPIDEYIYNIGLELGIRKLF